MFVKCQIPDIQVRDMAFNNGDATQLKLECMIFGTHVFVQHDPYFLQTLIVVVYLPLGPPLRLTLRDILLRTFPCKTQDRHNFPVFLQRLRLRLQEEIQDQMETIDVIMDSVALFHNQIVRENDCKLETLLNITVDQVLDVLERNPVLTFSMNTWIVILNVVQSMMIEELKTTFSQGIDYNNSFDILFLLICLCLINANVQ